MSQEYLIESTKAWIIENDACFVITENLVFYKGAGWESVSLSVLVDIIKAQKINIELMPKMNRNIVIAAFQELDRSIIKSDGKEFGKKIAKVSRFDAENNKVIAYAKVLVEDLEDKYLSIPWKTYTELLQQICEHFGETLTTNPRVRSKILHAGVDGSSYIPRLREAAMLDFESYHVLKITKYVKKIQMLWLKDAPYKECTFIPTKELTDSILNRVLQILNKELN